MFWLLGLKACGILPPQPGLKPVSPVSEGKVVTTGLPGQSPHFKKKFYFYLLSIYLAAPGLSCGRWALQSSLQHVGSLVMAYELLVAPRPSALGVWSEPLDHQWRSPSSILNQLLWPWEWNILIGHVCVWGGWGCRGWCRSATHKLLRSGSLLEKGLVTGRRQENAGKAKTTVAHYDGILLIAVQRRLIWLEQWPSSCGP